MNDVVVDATRTTRRLAERPAAIITQERHAMPRR